MTRSSPSGARRAIAAQIAIGIGGLAVLVLTPPARGAMLLLPIVDDAPAAVLARNGDAFLLGRGPAGGLLVHGERESLFWPLLRGGVLAIAAPSALCGERS